MNCAHPHTFEKLGFDVVLREAARHALSEDAREQLLATQPSSATGWVIPELKRVQEMHSLLVWDDPFPLSYLPSVGYILQKAAIEGNWVNVNELFTLLRWLKTAALVRDYIGKRREKYPLLAELSSSMQAYSDLTNQIARALDEQGNLRDDASPALAALRSSIRRTGVELRSTLNRILRTALENGWAQDKEITLRNDRLVIPLKADAKGRIPGFVQDISGSGGTVFVEPTECLQMNNQLRELHIEEQNEIVRILRGLTARIYTHIEGLLNHRELMTHLDMLRAKALLAQALQANLPQIEPEGEVLQLLNAFYPVLQLKALAEKAKGKEGKAMSVVPLEVRLDSERRILVISGPNAGGKSVSMKALGLLQLMLQSGMLIPVAEKSVFRLFDSLFIDIGDEQSVESDLSTYTSHLFQLRQMGDNMSPRSMFLIDEFGGGTDPSLGGAIAEAFLERFVRQGAYGIITTHYGNIKDFAEITPGVANAAMQFDTEALQPTYRLIEGIPGRSYAFEIAQRVGVHPSILKNARRKLGREQVSSEQLLRQLEARHTELSRLVNENRARDLQLKELVAKYESLSKELEKNRKQSLREAQLQARQLIADANQRIEATIREIREAQAERETTQRLRKTLAEKAPVVEEAEADSPEGAAPKGKQKEKLRILHGEVPAVGDYVKLKGSATTGRLVELNGERGVIEAGTLRVNVKLNQLHKIEAPQTEGRGRRGVSFSNRELSATRTELDVMGMRVEEALAEVEKFFDDAILSGLPYLRILHGKGSGALREAIRNYLRSMPQVKSLADASHEAGGPGWTIVELSA